MANHRKGRTLSFVRTSLVILYTLPFSRYCRSSQAPSIRLIGRDIAFLNLLFLTHLLSAVGHWPKCATYEPPISNPPELNFTKRGCDVG